MENNFENNFDNIPENQGAKPEEQNPGMSGENRQNKEAAAGEVQQYTDPNAGINPEHTADGSVQYTGQAYGNTGYQQSGQTYGNTNYQQSGQTYGNTNYQQPGQTYENTNYQQSGQTYGNMDYQQSGQAYGNTNYQQQYQDNYNYNVGNNTGYNQDYQNDADTAPMSMGEWVLTLLLMAIPCVNIVLCCVWAFGKNGNVNRRNFCRAELIFIGIGTVLGIIMSIVIMTAAIGSGGYYYY